LAEHLRLINPAAPPQPGGFVETDAARDMLRSINGAVGVWGAAMTMIAAAPGMGKTATLTHAAYQHRRAFMVTAVAGEGGVLGIAAAISRALELPAPKRADLPAARLRIAEEIEPEGLLMIDEAQNLVKRNDKGKDNLDAFEWCRGLCEEGCFTLVFAGDLKLAELVETLPQLRRRMLRPVVIRKIGAGDVAKIAAAQGVTDPQTVAALAGAARAHGALGDVMNVIAHARVFAGDGAVTAVHVAAAIADLKLGPKGAK
jgi:hypothetical protein